MQVTCPECLKRFDQDPRSPESICPHCGENLTGVSFDKDGEKIQTPAPAGAPPAAGASDVGAVCCPVCGRALPVEQDTERRVECPECETSFIPARALKVARSRTTPGVLRGRTLGAYRIVERLRTGGMGIVYRAMHATLDREVAVKVLAPAYAHDSEYRERFLREARITSLLEHPGIVKVYDAALDGEILYIAMELVHGRTLAEVMQEDGKPRPEDAARMMAKACEALQAAHEAGILHRDIKPENIILSESGEVKLTDFGLARRLQATTVFTQPGVVVGTPGYIPPEQFEKGEIDQRSDVYSLGATLYFLLTGSPPYEDDDLPSILFRKRWEEVPPAKKVARGVPETLSDIASKMLAKSPGSRYSSCGSAARDLRTFLEGGQVAVDVPKGEVPRSELPFGVVALRENLITEDQLLRCLTIQDRFRDQGRTVPPLGSIMVRRGLISPEKVPRVLGLQGSRAARCPRCGRTLGVKAEAVSRYLCPTCRTLVHVLPEIKVERRGDVTFVEVDGSCVHDDLIDQLGPVMEGVVTGARSAVILDLAGLRHASADLATEMVEWADRLKAGDATLKVRCAADAAKIFKRIGLSSVVDLKEVPRRRAGPAPAGEEERREKAEEGAEGEEEREAEEPAPPTSEEPSRAEAGREAPGQEAGAPSTGLQRLRPFTAGWRAAPTESSRAWTAVVPWFTPAAAAVAALSVMGLDARVLAVSGVSLAWLAAFSAAQYRMYGRSRLFAPVALAGAALGAAVAWFCSVTPVLLAPASVLQVALALVAGFVIHPSSPERSQGGVEEEGEAHRGPVGSATLSGRRGPSRRATIAAAAGGLVVFVLLVALAVIGVVAWP